MPGKLYLIPVTLGEETAPAEILPKQTLETVRSIKTFIVENEKSARHFLKKAGTPFAIPDIRLFPIGKHVPPEETLSYLSPLRSGEDIGLLSEAGCPGVADPGSEIVRLAHEGGFRVIPLTGPSSLLLSLMASGMNGQQFHFHGYLPIDKHDRSRYLKQMEKDARISGTTQLFIETPFRNRQLFEELLKTLDASTRLCVAADISEPGEFIRTATVASWRKSPGPDLHKRPAVFIIGK